MTHDYPRYAGFSDDQHSIYRSITTYCADMPPLERAALLLELCADQAQDCNNIRAASVEERAWFEDILGETEAAMHAHRDALAAHLETGSVEHAQLLREVLAVSEDTIAGTGDPMADLDEVDRRRDRLADQLAVIQEAQS